MAGAFKRDMAAFFNLAVMLVLGKSESIIQQGLSARKLLFPSYIHR